MTKDLKKISYDSQDCTIPVKLPAPGKGTGHSLLEREQVKLGAWGIMLLSSLNSEQQRKLGVCV